MFLWGYGENLGLWQEMNSEKMEKLIRIFKCGNKIIEFGN